jgi:urea ABC transporter ATP-binding protein UrtE
MLKVSELRAGYGSTLILSGVSLELQPGEVLALLGRNGAGKTTLMRTIIGLLRPRAGSIDFDGTSIVGLPPHRVAQKGIAFVPQGRGVFGKLSVRENLLIGTRAAASATAGQIPANVFDYFPILTERLEQRGATLSGGEQQMLAIARALCGRPRVLLLDEPSEGIQPSIVHDLGRLLRRIVSDESVAVLLVEQNLDLALQLADRALIMEKGSIVREARAAEFRDEEILNLQEFLAI